MQHHRLFHLRVHGCIAEPAEFPTVVCEQEFAILAHDPGADGCRGVPAADELRNLMGTIERVVGGMKGLCEKGADLLHVSFCCCADKEDHAAYSSMPSFAFTNAWTACGFALPPVAFITWPTNQPANAGFACALAT